MQTVQSVIDKKDVSSKGSMDNLQPRTDGDSRRVMVVANRNDQIEIMQVNHRHEESFEIPAHVTVLQRQLRYYGPELMVHSGMDEVDQNYLITAPGPDANLHLWGGVLTPNNKRENWVRIADITAKLADSQPKYETCNQCGDPIKTLDHEQAALVGECRR